MSWLSEILGRRMRLIEPRQRAITHQPDLSVAADDGAMLLTDRWVATASLGRSQPTVLVRSPYGRRGIVGLMFGRLLAERGLQVVVQSVRGTFGSGGTFAPFDERADGQATVRWLREQPWHNGQVGTFGPSYLGLAQWALAADAGDELGAMAIGVSASQFYDQTYAGGGMSLETAASWMAVMTAQERRLAPLAINRAVRDLVAPMSELPLGDLDERATGAVVPRYREAFSHPERGDAYRTARDFSGRVSEVTAPVSFVGGWYDIFLPWMLADHTVLQAAGRPADGVTCRRGRRPAPANARCTWRPPGGCRRRRPAPTATATAAGHGATATTPRIRRPRSAARSCSAATRWLTTASSRPATMCSSTPARC